MVPGSADKHGSCLMLRVLIGTSWLYLMTLVIILMKYAEGIDGIHGHAVLQALCS